MGTLILILLEFGAGIALAIFPFFADVVKDKPVKGKQITKKGYIFIAIAVIGGLAAGIDKWNEGKKSDAFETAIKTNRITDSVKADDDKKQVKSYFDSQRTFIAGQLTYWGFKLDNFNRIVKRGERIIPDSVYHKWDSTMYHLKHAQLFGKEVTIPDGMFTGNLNDIENETLAYVRKIKPKPKKLAFVEVAGTNGVDYKSQIINFFASKGYGDYGGMTDIILSPINGISVDTAHGEVAVLIGWIKPNYIEAD